MKTQTPAFPSRVIAILLGIALIAAACGGASGGSTAADPTSPPVIPPPDLAVVEAWVTRVSDAWVQLAVDLSSLEFEEFYLQIQVDDTSAPWLALFRGEAELYERFADVVEDAPANSGVEDDAAAFAAELRSAVTALRDLADDVAADPVFGGSLLDVVELEDVSGTHSSVIQSTQSACFPLQTAIADKGLPLIDCAFSQEPPEIDIGPEGTTILPDGFSGDLLEPGTYELAEFSRPFTIELTQPIALELSSRDIELRPIGDWEEPAYAFWIVTPDELPAPGTPYGPIDETVPFPDDLGSWLVESGLEIVAEGTTELAEGTAPYWTIEEPNWTLETSGAGMAIAAGSAFTLRHNSTIWQIPHPGGPLLVIAPEKWEIPLPEIPGIAELTDFVAAIISTIVPIDGAGAPAPTATPSESNNQPPGAGPDVAAMREAVLNLEEAEPVEYSLEPPFDAGSVTCDQPQYESERFPFAEGITEVGTPSYNVSLFEFASTADRDGYFAAVENGRSVCKARAILTFDPEPIEADPGRLLVYSVTVTDPDDNTWTVVSHATKVADTGVLSISGDTLDLVSAVLAELGLG